MYLERYDSQCSIILDVRTIGSLKTEKGQFFCNYKDSKYNHYSLQWKEEDEREQ